MHRNHKHLLRTGLFLITDCLKKATAGPIGGRVGLGSGGAVGRPHRIEGRGGMPERLGEGRPRA